MKPVFKKIALAVGCELSTASWLWACPRCLAASPYKTGLFWAVLVLLPVPFILAGWLVWFIRRSKPEFPPV